MTSFERLSFRSFLVASSMLSGISQVFAAGKPIGGDLPDIGGVDPGTSGNTESIRKVIISVLTTILNFLALLAVIFIVIAGIRLIVSQGEEEQKEKAKKTILYVIIGLIVILFARVIVSFFTKDAAQVITQ